MYVIWSIHICGTGTGQCQSTGTHRSLDLECVGGGIDHIVIGVLCEAGSSYNGVEADSLAVWEGLPCCQGEYTRCNGGGLVRGHTEAGNQHACGNTRHARY